MAKSVAVFVGSLRKASWNRKVARVLCELAPESLRPEIVEIGELPLYNQDLDDGGSPPAAWQAFRERVKAYDAVLFVTPEYNRSAPAALKNAIDVGSRPVGQSVWNGKPGAVISVSPGAAGGYGANQQVRQSLATLNVPCMPTPEAYIGGIERRFDTQGALTDEGTRKLLERFMTAYAAWVERNAL